MLRRYVLLAVLAATIAAGTILTVSHRAVAQNGGANLLPAVQSAGPVTVDNDQGILIGLLLPAVRQARDPFTELFFVDGMLVASVLIPPVPKTVGQVTFTAAYEAFGDGSVRLVIRQRGVEKPVFEGGAVQEASQVTSVLLPAVQRNGEPVRAISASVQSQRTDGGVWILPYIQQRPGGD